MRSVALVRKNEQPVQLNLNKYYKLRVNVLTLSLAKRGIRTEMATEDKCCDKFCRLARPTVQQRRWGDDRTNMCKEVDSFRFVQMRPNSSHRSGNQSPQGDQNKMQCSGCKSTTQSKVELYWRHSSEIRSCVFRNTHTTEHADRP
jgi:hypothetical protein